MALVNPFKIRRIEARPFLAAVGIALASSLLPDENMARFYEGIRICPRSDLFETSSFRHELRWSVQ